MAVLSTVQRKALPSSAFAGPGRSFPIPDKIHAEEALQFVGRSQAAGNIDATEASRIKSKARAKLSALNGSYAGKVMSAAQRG